MQPAGDALSLRAIAAQEVSFRFGMREIQAADAGAQQLAADRGHGVIHIDSDTGGADDFRCHQPGRACANYRDGRRAGDYLRLPVFSAVFINQVPNLLRVRNAWYRNLYAFLAGG